MCKCLKLSFLIHDIIGQYMSMFKTSLKKIIIQIALRHKYRNEYIYIQAQLLYTYAYNYIVHFLAYSVFCNQIESQRKHVAFVNNVVFMCDNDFALCYMLCHVWLFQCNPGTAVYKMADKVQNEPPYVMLMGPILSTVATAVAQVAHHWNITQVKV